MLGQLARKCSASSGLQWEAAWSDIQSSVCACLLSFLEVVDFAPKVKWNTCSAVQRLLQWKSWDEHTMFVCFLFLYVIFFVHRAVSLHVLNRRCRMHLGSVLCSTVANDSHYKVRCLPPYSLRFTDFITASQVIKSACVAARHVPSSAIIPKGVKDVASRFVIL